MIPVLHDISLTLIMEQVLRWQGIGEHLVLQPETTALLHEMLANVNDLRLLEPAITREL